MESKKLTIFDVAKWFLNKETMTHKKLQKLCWYAYSWFIYLNNENIERINNKLFFANFVAWVHGPANNELYNKYKQHGCSPIPKIENIDNKKYKNYEEYLENIYNIYGKMTGDELELQTHAETPWLNARVGLKPWQSSQNIINDKDIFKEYANRQ